MMLEAKDHKTQREGERERGGGGDQNDSKDGGDPREDGRRGVNLRNEKGF